MATVVVKRRDTRIYRHPGKINQDEKKNQKSKEKEAREYLRLEREIREMTKSQRIYRKKGVDASLSLGKRRND